MQHLLDVAISNELSNLTLLSVTVGSIFEPSFNLETILLSSGPFLPHDLQLLQFQIQL